ncbi:hypothetical protein [Pseudochrobactrum saccharolyticum]|uniref:hypothetical protein n=1 Tax=Pseudochrobactrum saccharolyticum TaxID=354352 RepID=UPI00276C3A7A|nr:hypothetical protein [Pseudochrobactrum saccharolyticum]MDP8251489.1 hypothetical protein [Pseudochrobactrum saccharolyticum]
MSMLVKFIIFIGVSCNFLGSLMLLPEFRDMIQLPFFKWRSQYIHNKLLNFKNNNETFNGYITNQTLLSKSISNQEKFTLKEILKKKSPEQNLMIAVNEHDDLRLRLSLKYRSITNGKNPSLNIAAMQHSFNEINAELKEWQKESDPQERTDREWAIKLFITGFGCLTLGAFIDLFLP